MISNRLYLDYAATTPVDPDVVAAMLPYFTSAWGNSSSIHAAGRTAKAALEQSRNTIAESIGAEPSEITFTGGGTEANNHAVKGLAFAARRKTGRAHVLVSSIEHPAVLASAESLKEHGFSVGFIPVDSVGRIRLDELEHMLTPETCIVAVMHANNEIGSIQPISEAARITHLNNSLFHMDAVQTLGKMPLCLHDLEIDTAAFSAHKIYGPKGVGALYIKKGVEVDPLFHGGAQERNRRGGTENVPLIVGFAAAVRKAVELRQRVQDRLSGLREYLCTELAKRWNFVFFNGDAANVLPNIVSISFDSNTISLDGETLLMNLDLRGVSASSGSACSSGSVKPSHVLQAIGRDDATARSIIRLFFGRERTQAEIDSLLAVLDAIFADHHRE
ncbi:MAG: cysteine desulfurase family protein [Ignavibacteriales bacterium]|nr:cysteine desulfurase family protein [Ignavibacteriales bacterium]